MDFIAILESELGIKSIKNFKPMQPGDVKESFADIEKSKSMLGFIPKTDIKEGISIFIKWYLDYYNLSK